MPNNAKPQDDAAIGEKMADSQKRVLLLEDEDNLANLLKTHLKKNGFEVDCVVNGVDGLKLVMAKDYEVIVCDMMMPNLSGDMFYTAVERIKPRLCKRFVFMTGYTGEKKIEAFIRKIDGIILYKPFDLSDLLETVQQVIRTSGK